ncbi:hypothetical protein DDJ31_31890 [Streptomyces griseoviridis]|uniref:Secreted protein n=1 Tax=Streptomyces griseoviridis TaxID=45398 RepID=A0ABX5U256_STRGD|nr:hypothetical protein DDJ31_31890 [Streptomyces griseoviridis]
MVAPWLGAPVVLLEVVGLVVVGRPGQHEKRGQGGDGEPDPGQERLDVAGGVSREVSGLSCCRHSEGVSLGVVMVGEQPGVRAGGCGS